MQAIDEKSGNISFSRTSRQCKLWREDHRHILMCDPLSGWLKDDKLKKHSTSNKFDRKIVIPPEFVFNDAKITFLLSKMIFLT